MGEISVRLKTFAASVRVCFYCLASAHVVANPNVATEVADASFSCAASRPESLTASLLCADKAEAMRQLDEAGCLAANSPATVEVRSVWHSRESLAVDVAGRDPVVQAFMADCLVEAYVRSNPLDPDDKSAVDYLRSRLRDSDPQIVGLAMMSLAPILTKEDIDTIVHRGSASSVLVMPAVLALSFPCTPLAKSGIAAIQAVYAGTEQAKDIQQLVKGNAGLCDKVGPATPMKFYGEISVP